MNIKILYRKHGIKLIKGDYFYIGTIISGIIYIFLIFLPFYINWRVSFRDCAG